MANTKRTKRKDVEGDSSSHPDSDSGDELPQNEGNGDLVINSLIHIHEKCDSLLDQIKALNQAAGETEVPKKVSPLVTPDLVTPVITPVQENMQVITSVTQSLEKYLTQNVVDMVGDTNTDLETEGQLNDKIVRNSIEINIVIDEAGIQQPSKSIGEMLNKLPKRVSSEISEMNIIVSTPVYEWCFADMRMKRTPEFKQKALSRAEEVEWKGVGQGNGRPQPPERSPPSGGIPKGRGRAPTSSKPIGVPRKQSSGHKHNPFSVLATAAKQSTKATKRKKLDFDDGDEGKKARRSSESVEKVPHKQLPHKLLKKKSRSKNKAFTGAIKKSHKFCLGTVALWQIRKYQRSTELLCRKLCVARLIREVAQDFRIDLHFQATTLLAIQEAMEAWLVCLMEDMNLCVICAKWVTIQPRDLSLVCHIRVNNGLDMFLDPSWL